MTQTGNESLRFPALIPESALEMRTVNATENARLKCAEI